MRLFFMTFFIVSIFSSTAWSVELYVASSFEKFSKTVNSDGKTYADASSRLANQILAGASPDVFVSANRFWAAEVHKQYPTFAIQHIADNRLIIAGQKSEPRRNICDLKLGAALKEVPAGTYANRALELLGCTSNIVRAPNVGAVREWIKSGHIDGGFLYATDLHGDTTLTELHRFDRTEIAVSLYAIPLSLKGERWVNKVKTSPILTAHGFVPPEGTLVPMLRVGMPKNQHSHAEHRSENTQHGNQTTWDSVPFEPEKVNVVSILLNSALVGLLVVLLALGPAIFLGLLLARWSSRWKPIVSVFALAPLVVPPVVTGLVLLKLFGKHSFLSPAINSLGSPAFTWAGAVLASLVVSFPLFVVMSRRAFESVDRKYELAALSCGLSRWQTFRRVTLPLAMPGIIAGAMLTFARSLGEFGATAVFAGNLAAEGGTISLAIYRSLQSPTGAEVIWILTSCSILLSLIAIGIYEYFSSKQKALTLRKG